MQQLMTILELATFLQVPVPTIYRWRSRGEGPPGFRVGKYVRYDVGKVAAWLEQQADSGR